MTASNRYKKTVQRAKDRYGDYKTQGGRPVHIILWEAHHGAKLNTRLYIVHHKDHNKKHNWVCDGPEPCPNWQCGNLAGVTRREHILEHRPGRMGGRRLKNKIPPRVYRCVDCGKVKSRYGERCKVCRYRVAPAA